MKEELRSHSINECHVCAIAEVAILRAELAQVRGELEKAEAALESKPSPDAGSGCSHLRTDRNSEGVWCLDCEKRWSMPEIAALIIATLTKSLEIAKGELNLYSKKQMLIENGRGIVIVHGVRTVPIEEGETWQLGYRAGKALEDIAALESKPSPDAGRGVSSLAHH